MKLSLRWLSRHVDLHGLEPQRLLGDLTMSTAEMEGLHRFGAGLEAVVVGSVVARERHPDADKLSVCQVDLGDGRPLPVVCGAPNVAKGQRVAVVREGDALPGPGGAPLSVRRARIRGVESLGVICSERELGLSDEHSGILVLDGSAEPGARLVDTLPVQDWVLEIDNKSVNHRPDLWGHHGFARELAAIYGRELRPLPAPPKLPKKGSQVPVEIRDRKACPRYCGLVVEGVPAAPSPPWLRWLLHAVGQRAIHLAVDLTNFAMLDLGQPMHAFDVARLRGRGIVVRMARKGETIRTLDGAERRLQEQDLLICAGDEPEALAGIMGGAGSMVESGTTALFLESANFHAATIRRTSVRLGLRTEASARFEKAQDPANAELALWTFLHELHGIAPQAHAAGPLSDPAGFRFEPPVIRLRRARLDLKLGHHVPDVRVISILGALQFGVRKTGDGFDVRVPSFRATKDISIEDDLIEEVGRMYRYDNIPERPLTGEVRVPPRDPELHLVRRAVEVCAAELHCAEVYNYSFVSDAVVAAAGAGEAAYAVVKNPVAPELRRIRRHVLPGLLANVRENLRHAAEVRLCEHGKGYHPEVRDGDGLPREVSELAIAFAVREGAHPYGELREGVLVLLERLGFRCAIRQRHGGSGLPWVHPARSAALDRGGTVVGFVGHVHPEVLAGFELPGTVAVANIDVRVLLGTGRETSQYRALPVYPDLPVDVALLVGEEVQVAAVEAMLREAGGGLVRKVELFEVYRGEGLPPGKKSLNFTVVLGSDERTLADRDEAGFIAAVRERAAAMGAELRG